MRTVYPPSRPPHRDADRSTECCTAIEPALMQLLDRAQGVGWQRAELLRAVLLLARDEIETATIFSDYRDTGNHASAI